MDTHLATNQIRLQQWAAIFKDKTESGLKVDDYYEQHQLSRNAYYYWLRRVKEATLKASLTNFVEIEAPKLALPGSALSEAFVPRLTLQVNGTIIGVDSTTPKELLSMVLKVVKNAE